MTQIEKIDQYIKEYGSITILDAFRDLGICNFTARTTDMRHAGFPIIGIWETGKNRYGENVRYMRYYYKNDDEISQQKDGC